MHGLEIVVVLGLAVLVCQVAARRAGVAAPVVLLGGGFLLVFVTAAAVGVLAKALPRRQVTILRAESLINDGTALAIYGLAVGITIGEQHLSLGHVTRLLPFTAYLLAELAHASGALAVVVCGLIMSQAGPRIGRPAQRRQTEDSWSWPLSSSTAPCSSWSASSSKPPPATWTAPASPAPSP